MPILLIRSPPRRRAARQGGGQAWRRPDPIKWEFTAETPGTRLVGDITHLRTAAGWLYLATVIDLATRMVGGWQLAEHMRTSWIVDALKMARIGGHLAPDAVFHSSTQVWMRLPLAS